LEMDNVFKSLLLQRRGVIRRVTFYHTGLTAG
jgi:hypothetical protein